MLLYCFAFILKYYISIYTYRKLRATLDEYTTRVGQQAIVLCISPSKPNPVFKVFGAAPLENVVSVIGIADWTHWYAARWVFILATEFLTYVIIII